MKNKPSDYKAIKAWGKNMGSFDPYIEGEQEKAAEMNAPLDALYERDGKWATMAELAPDHPFRSYYASMFPPVEKMTFPELVAFIGRNWRPMHNTARPYFGAMQGFDSLSKENTAYGMGQESAGSTVLYFLNNAGTWKGPVAKECKAELKRRLKAAGVRF